MEGVKNLIGVFNLWLNGCIYTTMEELFHPTRGYVTIFYPSGRVILPQVIYTPVSGLLVPQWKWLFIPQWKGYLYPNVRVIPHLPGEGC